MRSGDLLAAIRASRTGFAVPLLVFEGALKIDRAMYKAVFLHAWVYKLAFTELLSTWCTPIPLLADRRVPKS